MTYVHVSNVLESNIECWKIQSSVSWFLVILPSFLVPTTENLTSQDISVDKYAPILEHIRQEPVLNLII